MNLEKYHAIKNSRKGNKTLNNIWQSTLSLQ